MFWLFIETWKFLYVLYINTVHSFIVNIDSKLRPASLPRGGWQLSPVLYLYMLGVLMVIYHRNTYQFAPILWFSSVFLTVTLFFYDNGSLVLPCSNFKELCLLLLFCCMIKEKNDSLTTIYKCIQCLIWSLFTLQNWII